MADAVQMEANSLASTPAHTKLARFAWRVARNLSCLIPGGKSLLFPPMKMAAQFGPDDLSYGIKVFEQHWSRLISCGFERAHSILEVGPGRNVTTALLLWATLTGRSDQESVTITLWDVFPNMRVDEATIADCAKALLQRDDVDRLAQSEASPTFKKNLQDVATRNVPARIAYSVAALPDFFASRPQRFDLVYSHASIEHIWEIDRFWEAVIAATLPNGWHSHRIDLADHGRRSTNYIEMLEWSAHAYWLMLRFIPGATNRWRACHHLDFVQRHGIEVLRADRTLRPVLPVPRESLAEEFRSLPEEDLRAVALDLTAYRGIA